MLCGLYELDITSPLGVNLPGYFEARVASGVRDNLFVRAMALENSEGTPFILINMDAITSEAAQTAFIRDRVSRFTGVPGGNIMVTATHIHTGGPVDAFVPGTLNEEYMQWLAGRAADAAEELLACLG